MCHIQGEIDKERERETEWTLCLLQLTTIILTASSPIAAFRLILTLMAYCESVKKKERKKKVMISYKVMIISIHVCLIIQPTWLIAEIFPVTLSISM